MTLALALRARYARLARRERAILALAGVVVVLGLGFVTSIDPALSKKSLLERQIASQRTEIDTLQEAIAAASHDPNAPLREQLGLLRDQIRVTDGQFERLQYGLVQPQHMGDLLQSLLREHRGLQLLGLRTLPVVAMIDPALDLAKGASAGHAPAAAGTASASGAADDDAWLFRHSVEIKIQGSYADMVSYLQDIEGLPRRVHWGGLEIDARRYPASVMTVTIYTVSLDRTWWVL
jgi:MSHA biogenesis protein MshJ